MKKFVAYLLLVTFLVLSLSPVNASASDGYAFGPGAEKLQTQALKRVEPFEYDFQPVSAGWSSLIGYEKPVEFTKVHYQLADNVLVVDKKVTDSIASAGQILTGSMEQKLRPSRIIEKGGYVPIPLLDAAAKKYNREIKNGTVVVDESSGTAFKVVSPTIYNGFFKADDDLEGSAKVLEGNYSIARPALHEVVKDFELQEETVKLTRGNISGFAPNIEKNFVLPPKIQDLSYGDSLKGFKYLSKDPLINLQFKDEKLEAKAGNTSISCTVSGGLGIDNIELTGRYSGFDGYRITMTLKQESYLVVELDAEVHEEIRIPILGIDVPFGIGRVSGGIFAVVGMDGTVRIELAAREFTSTTMGVRGSTKFYVPTSVHPVFDRQVETDGDTNITGKIDGYVKFGPMIELEIFGFDLVGAGVFLGAGVHAEIEAKSLNVELYALFNVYVKFAGEHFNLINARPTIWKRKQANTAGLKVSIKEAFIKPGRVGGVIEREADKKIEPDGYLPATDIKYRVIVVPDGVPFNIDDPNVLSTPGIRFYPSSDYARTNEEGEFIQKDERILFNKDKAYLEFILDDVNYFCDPTEATLPFEDIDLIMADYFNDFATGQVEPVKVINWEAKNTDPPEDQMEWAYYSNGMLYVTPYSDYVSGGTAMTRTDAYGYFDTRQGLKITDTVSIPNQIDIKPICRLEENYNILQWTTFALTIDHNEAVMTKKIGNFYPTASFNVERVLDEVENSWVRDEKDGKIIDRMMVDEYIWISNPYGTRTITDSEFDYAFWGFSTQDYLHRVYNKTLGTGSFGTKDIWENPPITEAWTDQEKLTPVLDKNGNQTGSALFSHRVTLEWTWQAHPNPVTITSPDHLEASVKGGAFQVTATGFGPFEFSLIGAPPGVTINEKSGLITIPSGLAVKSYPFTIHAKEALILLPAEEIKKDDPRKGHDPSPPDDQAFTLTISKEPAATPEPTPTPEASQPPENTPTATPTPGLSPTPTPSVIPSPTATPSPTPPPPETPTPTPTPTPEPRTAPVIVEGDHNNYQFVKLINGGDLVAQIRASGSTPIIYSLAATNPRQGIPKEVSIDPYTGVLTVKEGISTGQYFFAIKAENDAGSDLQDCRLDVKQLTVPPIKPGFPKLPGASWDKPAVMSLAVKSEPDISDDQPGAVPMSFGEPVNHTLMRCDHKEDVYSLNRNAINGATYLRWDSYVTLKIENEELEFKMPDNSPVSDQYHYYRQIDVPEDVIQAAEAKFKEQLSDYQKGNIFLGDELTTEGLLGGFNQYTVNPLHEDGTFYLEYGPLLDAMNKQKGGTFNVDLNDTTGTMVTGKYFTGLQNNQKAAITFTQPGASITFAGRDIQKAEDYRLYDFGYMAKAPHETDMLSAMGTGNSAFTYGFQHHGELPGMATFAITTNFAQGTRVNVYRFDTATKEFTLIAGDVQVEAQGVVTYQNNTMSEYLITAETLSDAIVSAVAMQQGSKKNRSLWLICAGAAILIVGVGILLLLSFRNKRKKQQSE